MTREEFLKFKGTLPAYNNGRAVRVFEFGTKGADVILERASNFEGLSLNDVYSYPSDLKVSAFNDCVTMFSNDISAEGFHICSHNCQSFTVAWSTPTTVVFLTRATENIVVF
jgi:hypothetical protein